MSESLIQKLRGACFMLGGGALLLYNFGLFQKIGSSILVIFSLFLIVAGFLDAGFQKLFIKNSRS